jgi:hypothetical protein
MMSLLRIAAGSQLMTSGQSTFEALFDFFAISTDEMGG